jgi:hypothetical protein
MTGNIGDSTTVPVIFILEPTELVEKNAERIEREKKKNSPGGKLC